MKKLLIVLLVVLGFAGGWYWLRHRGAATAAEEEAKPVARVTTCLLERRVISRTLQAFGVVALAPSGETTTAAPYDCIIRKINVAVGTPVAASQVLLEIDSSPDAKLALDSARSVLGLATRVLTAAQERYDLKLATSQELLAAQQAEADARLKLTSLEARGLGGDGLLRSAAAGVISRLDLQAGAFATTGTPLITVSHESHLEARVGLEAKDLPNVTSGQAVVLTSANRGDGERIVSVVRNSGRALDATTGAAEVRVPVPSGAPLLLGEHVVASIEVARKEDALVVPRSAVLLEDDKHVLFVVRDGRAVKREVNVGLTNDAQVEVSGAGLQAGDVVVTLGNYELEDGMAVQITGPEGEGKTAPVPEAKP